MLPPAACCAFPPGGIMKCDVIASGIVNAAKQVGVTCVPRIPRTTAIRAAVRHHKFTTPLT